jgi:CRISPR-associated endonuclease/helicase Cas3
MHKMTFTDFFRTATGNSPYEYQRRLARDQQLDRAEVNGASCQSQLINIPTGLGKTAAVGLAWLWNRVHQSNPDWPRRLIYCLPMRTLVEQTEREFRKWLEAHGLLWDGKPETRKGKVGVHVLMGGEETGDWDIFPEESAVLIGTQDMLLSRALNRGYGMSRYRWPMHFGLLNNDCLWIMDETQLMGVGVETSAQLDGFRHNAKTPTFGVCPTWWMSATLESTRLATVDHAQPPEGWPLTRLEEDDRSRDDVKARVCAAKRLAPCGITLSATTKDSYPKQLVEWLSGQHQPGSLTIVVVNNVSRAQEVYSQLKKLKLADPIGLIHSRFRPDDRKKHEALLRAQGGRIIVATQAVEAGVDVSARTLITELAPWSSLVQRFGRCNRHGELKQREAGIFWINIEIEDDKDSLASPYDAEELALARKALKLLEDAGPESLQNVSVQERRLIRPVIRRKDIVELFDTTPDLAGHDLDISRYIRDGDDTDVQVFWRNLGGCSPTPNEPAATRDELCRVSLPRFREFLDRLRKAGVPKLRAYVWNQLTEKWEETPTARAGVTYLLDTQAGGYTTQLGWFGAAKFASNVSALPQPERTGAAGYSDNRLSFQRAWVTLSDHTQHVVHEMRKLLPLVPLQFADVFTTAAGWHDVGKAHEIFQKMIIGGDAQRATVLWAKSGSATGRCQRRFFRHELASALAWLDAGPPNTPERDLIAYLLAAHHGKVRLSIRSLPEEEPPTNNPQARIARGILQGDSLGPLKFGDVCLPRISVDLSLMEMGQDVNGNRSWLSRMLALRDRFGPFKLAYLESLLRAADMRASAQESDLIPLGLPAQEMSLRENASTETVVPVLSAQEQSLVSELVADGLSIQEKFRPEPLYKQTGKGHYEAKTVEEIQKAKKRKGRPQ